MNKTFAPTNYLSTVDEDLLNREYDFGFLDRDNPRSLINILPPQTAKIVDAIPKNYFLMSETELKKVFKCREQDTCIRLKFWDEYSYAQSQNTAMKPMNIIHGVCSPNYWQHEVLKNNARFAYILRVPVDYGLMMRAKLNRSMKDVEDILEAPIYRRVLVSGSEIEGNAKYTKEYDKVMIAKKLETFKYLDQRVNGAIMQKIAIEQKSMNYHINAPQNQQLLSQEISTEDFKNISGKLEKMERMLLEAQEETETMDVVVEESIDESGS